MPTGKGGGRAVKTSGMGGRGRNKTKPTVKGFEGNQNNQHKQTTLSKEEMWTSKTVDMKGMPETFLVLKKGVELGKDVFLFGRHSGDEWTLEDDWEYSSEKFWWQKLMKDPPKKEEEEPKDDDDDSSRANSNRGTIYAAAGAAAATRIAKKRPKKRKANTDARKPPELELDDDTVERFKTVNIGATSTSTEESSNDDDALSKPAASTARPTTLKKKKRRNKRVTRD